MRKILTTLTLLFSVIYAYPQQDAQFSQNMFNKLAINPGYAGSNDAICGVLLYRNQWMGFPGSPKTFLFSAEMPIYIIHSGVGLNVTSDKLGFENNLQIKGSFAYRIPVGTGKLGIGADIGYMQKSLDGTKFIANDPNDPSIQMAAVAGGAPDFSFGLFYNTTDLYAGVSTTHLAANSISMDLIKTTMARHYYFMGGYTVHTKSPNWDIKPSILVKSDGASTQLDANCLVDYKLNGDGHIWAGASYRIQDAIVALLGFGKGPFNIGLAYDFTTSEIKNYSSGTPELMLKYCYKPIKVIHTSRHQDVRNLGRFQK